MAKMTPHPILRIIDQAGLRARRACQPLVAVFGSDGLSGGGRWARLKAGSGGFGFNVFKGLGDVFGPEGLTGLKISATCARLPNGVGGKLALCMGLTFKPIKPVRPKFTTQAHDFIGSGPIKHPLISSPIQSPLSPSSPISKDKEQRIDK